MNLGLEVQLETDHQCSGLEIAVLVCCSLEQATCKG